MIEIGEKSGDSEYKLYQGTGRVEDKLKDESKEKFLGIKREPEIKKIYYREPDINTHSLPPSAGRVSRLRKPKEYRSVLDKEINSLLYDDIGRIIGVDGKLFITEAEDNASYTQFKMNSLKFSSGANTFWDLTKMSKGNYKVDI